MSTCLKGGYGTLHPLMRKTEPDFSHATFSASALFVWAGAVASLQWCLYAAACVRYECLKGGFDSSPLLVCELSRAARNSVRHSDIQSIGFPALTRESQCDEVRPGPIKCTPALLRHCGNSYNWPSIWHSMQDRLHPGPPLRLSYIGMNSLPESRRRCLQPQDVKGVSLVPQH